MTTKQLMTSLAEIRGFNPCAAGWKKILEAHKEKAEDEQFPLADCLVSNTVSDVLWLVGKRRVEIEIAVNAATKFAHSVARYDNRWSHDAAADAADAAAYAAADDAAYAAAAAADDAAYAAAAYAVDAAYAAADAAYAAADAAQWELNKQLLLAAIREYEESHQ